ncbi:MAG: TVP38/TMEM64 family protein [Solirubrobacteraceae bacterium]
MLGLAALLAACLLVAPLRHALGAATHGDVNGLRLQLRGLGVGGVLVLVAVVLAHTVVPFPAEIPAAVAGFVYGVAFGLPLMSASFLASALAAYFLADWLGRPVARRLVGAARLDAVERVVGRGGVRTLLVLRLIPFVPFSLMCFVCGFGRVPVGRYTWTTAVGMLPQLILVTLLGSRLAHPRLTDPLLWGPALGMVALVLLGPAFLRRRRRPVSAT